MKRRRLVRESTSPGETEAIGRELAADIVAGDVLLLYGDLGAGKTVLARGIIQALPGGEGRPVRSPTYMYVQHHATDPPLNHVDLYRLPAEAAPEDLGLDEWANEESVTIVEWPQMLRSRDFPSCTEVHIEILDNRRRKILVESR